MDMPMIVVWIAVMIAFLLIEAATVNLVTIWFAVGALGAAASAGLGWNLAVQIVVFVAMSGVALAITKPLAKKLRKRKDFPTNADRILEKEGIVTENIDPVSGSGQVKVLGQSWSAKSEDDRMILAGSKVVVRQIEGVKAVVEEKEEV